MITADELREKRKAAINTAFDEALDKKLIEKAEKGYQRICFYEDDFPMMKDKDRFHLPVSFWKGLKDILEEAGFRCNRLYKNYHCSWGTERSTWVETENWEDAEWWTCDGIAVYFD